MFVAEDGTAYKDDGTAIFFPIERFIREIVSGDCCFVCGKSPTAVPFNDEHVIPNWILKKCELRDQQITLPNGTCLKYSQYTVPCCKDCNSLMGETFEVPISAAFENGIQGVADLLRDIDGRRKLFIWLALIYLKTHLKDCYLRTHRDLRLTDEKIGEIYDWEVLHHVHCVARSFLAKATIEPEVFGSLFLLPAKQVAGERGFDYGDNYMGRSLLLRIGDAALVTVLNDSSAAAQFRMEPEQEVLGRPLLSEINRPLSPVQLREVLTDLAYVNIRIEDRPVFHTAVDVNSESCSIGATVPPGYTLGVGNVEAYGRMLYFASQDIIGMLPEPTRTTVKEQVLTGHYSFLFGPDGKQADCDI